MIKNIKIILLSAVIAFFMSAPNASEAKDCSHVVKLHKKLMCQAGSDDSEPSTTSEKTEKVKKEKSSRRKEEEKMLTL